MGTLTRRREVVSIWEMMVFTINTVTRKRKVVSVRDDGPYHGQYDQETPGRRWSLP
jgi:hypothetical protein